MRQGLWSLSNLQMNEYMQMHLGDAITRSDRIRNKPPHHRTTATVAEYSQTTITSSLGTTGIDYATLTSQGASNRSRSPRSQSRSIQRFRSDNSVPKPHNAINLYHPKTDQKP